jgi:endonuclease/exonuclease/phosphatase family metal-dependent hydrolase
VPPAPPPVAQAVSRIRLKLLSYNIQVGMVTRHPGHYLTGAWRHVLPSAAAYANLDRVAEVARGYDFVAIQEADAGSLRTRYRNQIEYLAHRAGYAHCGFAVTRELLPVARHCMGFLSKYPPAAVHQLRLPSRIPGRSAMTVRLGAETGGLTAILTHLSLGHRSQVRQLEFLGALVPPNAPTVLLGDLNCEADTLRAISSLVRCGLQVAAATPPTYPSWRPRRRIDHILTSPAVELYSLRALPLVISDHLPLAAEIGIALDGPA